MDKKPATRIVVVCGLPGSGKSYFASRLAERLKALYINSDRVRRQMYAVRTYSEEEKSSVYHEIVARVQRAVSEKKDVVVDATFHRKDMRKLISKIAGPAPRWIEVRAEESVIRSRLAKPRTDSEADFEVYLKLRDAWEPLAEEYLVLQSTDENIDEMINQALQYIHRDPR